MEKQDSYIDCIRINNGKAEFHHSTSNNGTNPYFLYEMIELLKKTKQSKCVFSYNYVSHDDKELKASADWSTDEFCNTLCGQIARTADDQLKSYLSSVSGFRVLSTVADKLTNPFLTPNSTVSIDILGGIQRMCIVTDEVLGIQNEDNYYVNSVKFKLTYSVKDLKHNELAPSQMQLNYINTIETQIIPQLMTDMNSPFGLLKQVVIAQHFAEFVLNNRLTLNLKYDITKQIQFLNNNHEPCIYPMKVEKVKIWNAYDETGIAVLIKIEKDGFFVKRLYTTKEANSVSFNEECQQIFGLSEESIKGMNYFGDYTYPCAGDEGGVILETKPKNQICRPSTDLEIVSYGFPPIICEKYDTDTKECREAKDAFNQLHMGLWSKDDDLSSKGIIVTAYKTFMNRKKIKQSGEDLNKYCK